MSAWTLAVSSIFVAVAILLSMVLRLGLTKDLIIASVRSTVQLILVGYILVFVFHARGHLLVVAMLSLMILVAAFNVRSRARQIPGVVWIVLAALLASELGTQALLLGFGVIPFTPRYEIPISGMVIGNAMVASGLLLNRLQADVRGNRAGITAVLALGGTPRQAIAGHLKQAIRASLIPTIDSTKTTGLVQLPGMMTGQIIAGADPVQAVRYQLMILFCLMTGASVASIGLALLTYPKLFNRYQQLCILSDT